MRIRLLFAASALAMLSACAQEEDLGIVDTSDPPTGTAVSTTAPDGETTEPAQTSDQTVQCPDIGFTPNSDDVAADITAVGTSCSQAAQVVSAVKSADGLSYTAQGFECTGVEDPTAVLRTVNWTCINGAQQITFSKT